MARDGERERREEHLLFPRLTYKVRFAAHVCMAPANGRGTTDWKIVVASWRILLASRGVPPRQEKLRIELRTTGNWCGGISSLRTTISLTYLFYPSRSSRSAPRSSPPLRRRHPGVDTHSLSAVSASENSNAWKGEACNSRFYAILALH